MYSAARSVLAATLALGLAWPVVRGMSRWGPARRRMGWGLLACVALTPVLLVGYAYGPLGGSLARWPVMNQGLGVLLLAGRCLPLVALVWLCAPEGELSPAGWWLWRRARVEGRGLWPRLGALGVALRGPWRRPAGAWALGALLAFQDFELVSLLGVRPQAWTERLFDLQALGPTLGETLRLAVVPALVAWAPGAWVAVSWGRGSLASAVAGRGSAIRAAGAQGFAADCLAWGALGLAFGLMVAWPLARVALDSGAAWGSPAMWAQAWPAVGASVGYGVAGAFGAWGLVVLGGRLPARWRGVAGLAVSLPGLAGSLVIAVGSLALWNLGVMRPLYDTPAPLTAALVLQLLPWAVLLDGLVSRGVAGQAVHAARLLAAGGTARARGEGVGLLWRLAWGPRFAAGSVLFCIAYADLASTALLHPSGTAPAPVLLYNLMHYGRTGTLSAMVLIVALAPMLVIVLARACVAAWVGPLGRARWS